MSRGWSWFFVTSLIICVCTIQPAARQTPQGRAHAETAIREGRPKDAIQLLEATVRTGGADGATRLVYVVALLADGQLDLARTEVGALKRLSAVPAQSIEILESSLERITTVKTVSTQVEEFLKTGNVTGALRAIDGSPVRNLFGPARTALLRLTGAWEQAIDSLADTSDYDPAAAESTRMLDEIRQQASKYRRARAEVEMMFGRVSAGAPCREDPQCFAEVLTETGRSLQTLFESAPFSRAGLAARLAQSIWLGKDDDARELVRLAKVNYNSAEIWSGIDGLDVGVRAAGRLVFDFANSEVSWVATQDTWFRGKGRPAFPINGSTITFQEARSFKQRVSVNTYPDARFLSASVGFEVKAGPMGGVSLPAAFMQGYGEVPLRIATRAYAAAVAECLGLAKGKYSVISEKPSHKGAILMGIAGASAAGLAASGGNAAGYASASQIADEYLQRAATGSAAADAARRDWTSSTGQLRLAMDVPAIRQEVSRLLPDAAGAIEPYQPRPWKQSTSIPDPNQLGALEAMAALKTTLDEEPSSKLVWLQSRQMPAPQVVSYDANAVTLKQEWRSENGQLDFHEFQIPLRQVEIRNGYDDSNPNARFTGVRITCIGNALCVRVRDRDQPSVVITTSTLEKARDVQKLLSRAVYLARGSGGDQ